MQILNRMFYMTIFYKSIRNMNALPPNIPPNRHKQAGHSLETHKGNKCI